jgi:hypothetical protein
MRNFFSLLSVFFFFLFIFSSCDHTAEDKAEALQKELFNDSVDSVKVVMAAQKIVEDSATKIDKILRDSCPELKEYIRLNKSAIAIVGGVGSDKAVSKRYDELFDSIKKEENSLMKTKFKNMSASNAMRFIHLSLLYTNILTGSLMDQTGLNISTQVESNDSLLWKIENGK